jgi:hypothetical protein
VAQSNKFRTKRRRLNGKREQEQAHYRRLCAAHGLVRAQHETLRSAIKRDHAKIESTDGKA